MDIYYVQIDNIRIKSFSKFELAFDFIKKYEKKLVL